MDIQLTSIGTIHSPFTGQAGTPIQPCFAEGAEGRVDVDPALADGLRDLAGFERIWLVYLFHQAGAPRLRVKPYLDSVERGVFATRAPVRPNPIGLSCVRLLAVEGATLRVAEIDVLDGTPLLDIKPYVLRFDAYAVQRQGWMNQANRASGTADSRFVGP